MKKPPRWITEELTAEGNRSRSRFQRERLDEPLELYIKFFETFAAVFDRLLSKLPDLMASQPDIESLVEVIRDADAKTAFRYLAAPPVSEDDLKTLAGTTLSAAALRQGHAQAKRVRDIVLHIIDPFRFPWIAEDRASTDEERNTAIVASAALVAAKKVETKRRMGAKQEQEEKVKHMLQDANFTEISPRDIPLLSDAPNPGEFCGESKLGETRADVVIGLHDGRVMPIECKVSNSGVNSFKRVNHEAVGKARAWLDSFGSKATVPAAVLSGVFSIKNLETAQTEGLTLFWSHKLKDLRVFIEAART